MVITVRLPISGRKLLVVLGVLSFLIVAGILVWPKKSLSQTELEYFREQTAAIKQNDDVVQSENKREIEASMNQQHIEAYQQALLEGLATCEQIGNHLTQADKETIKPYQDSISQLRLFCNDFGDVVDYARKSSKATRQFITQPTNLLESNNPQGLTDLQEILGYTRSDLEKLKSNPIKDPALEEQITSIDNLQKQTEEAIKANSPKTTAALLKKVNDQKISFLTARQYFWNNTVQIESLGRSIVRVKNLFDSQPNL